MPESNKIMVLGAGIFQVPLIQYLRQQGYEVLVCSNNSADPGFEKGSSGHLVSTVDKEEIFRLAEFEKVSAVLTTASEVAIPTLGYVNNKLGLRGINEQLAALIAHKYKLRQHLKEKGVQIPAFHVDPVALMNELSDFVIQKPVKGGGSRDVQQVTSDAIADDQYFFEERIDGQEFGGDFIVSKGEVVFFCITQKRVNKHLVPYQHLIADEPNAQQELCDYFQEIVNACEIADGIFNFDLIHDDTGYWLIDFGARIGGNCIPEIIHLQTGVNEYEIQLNQALGNDIEVQPNTSNTFYGVHIFGAEDSGILAGYNLEALDELMNADHLETYHLRWAQGERVEAFTEGKYHGGYIIFKAGSAEQLKKVARNIAGTVWMVWE